MEHGNNLNAPHSISTSTEEAGNAESKNDSIIVKTGKFGIKGLKYFLLTVLIFGFINSIFFISSFFLFKNTGTTSLYILSVILILFIGIIFTGIGLYLTYKYILLNGINNIYELITPFLKKLCNKIIEKTGIIAQNNLHIKDAHVNKMINIENSINEFYGKKVPGFLRKGLSFLIKKIPFYDLLWNIKDSVKDKDKEKVGLLLFEQVNNYVKNSILGNNSMKWLYWLIPVNIGFQLLLIYIMRSFML